MENQKLSGSEWMGGPDWGSGGAEARKDFLDGWEASDRVAKEDFWFWAETVDFEKLFTILKMIVRPMRMGAMIPIGQII